METPPPYIPPQRPKSSNAVVWWVVGGVSLCCVLPGLLLGGLGFWGFNKIKGTGGCALAFNDLEKAFPMYAADHKGKLPQADKWQDEMREYYRKSLSPANEGKSINQMTPDGDWGCVDSEGKGTGLAFNSDLSGKKLAEISDPTTPLVFEVESPSKNQHEKYKARPFTTSPFMIGNLHRGWMELPVSGDPVLVNQNGARVPVRTNTGPGQFNVEVNTKHTGKDDQ